MKKSMYSEEGESPIDLMMIGSAEGQGAEYITKCPYESLPEGGCCAHNFLVSAMYTAGEEPDHIERGGTYYMNEELILSPYILNEVDAKLVAANCFYGWRWIDGIFYGFNSLKGDYCGKKFYLLVDAVKLLCEVCKKEYAAKPR